MLQRHKLIHDKRNDTDHNKVVLSDEPLSEVNGGKKRRLIRVFIENNLDRVPPSYAEYFVNDPENGRRYNQLQKRVCTNPSSPDATEEVRNLMREACFAG